MGRATFERWIANKSDAISKKRGIYLEGAFVSWHDLRESAKTTSGQLISGRAYIADPGDGIECFKALFSIAMCPNTLLLWGRHKAISSNTRKISNGLYEVIEPNSTSIERPMYGSLTSGSSGTSKIPIGFGDCLENVALTYSSSIFSTPDFETDIIATCLPLEYTATFMMAIVPCMYTLKDLLIFSPRNWGQLWRICQDQRVVCLAVPALFSAASASVAKNEKFPNLTMLSTAGHLAPARVDSIRNRLGSDVWNSYGASEIGVITVDRQPGNDHVGQVIFGKSVWVDSASNQTGPIRCVGADCRERYWPENTLLLDEHGTVTSPDLGHFDELKNLYLDGRIDQGDKLKGFTVYLKDVERHILNLPEVVDAQVEIKGFGDFERIYATVIGNISTGEVREWCLSLPEVSRPAAIKCMPDTPDSYSSRGKFKRSDDETSESAN